MTFETALTGLNAAAADLDVTGNNIANSQTIGFKMSRAEFADIFASSNLGVARTAVGQGVRVEAVRQQFTQGQFTFTGNTLDLAISGNGFFQVSANGQLSYTRNGAFTLDRDGYIVDANNRRLQGFGVDSSGNIGTGSYTDLRVHTGPVAPRASSAARMTANLQSGTETPTVTPFDPTNADSYSFSTSTTVYDSQGRAHLQSFYFVKLPDGPAPAQPNQWAVYSQLAGYPDAPSGPNVVTFNADGTVNNIDGGPTEVTYNFAAGLAGSPLAGANDLTITTDFAGLTQFGTAFAVTELNQDGYAAGQFSSLTVEKDGTIFARYSNGQSTTLGQVMLVQFPSQENLQQTGDTSWVETFASGAPLRGQPELSGLGSVQSGTLEQSNVNVSEQLVRMITAQRNYQANAKMISTQDQMSQEILNIR